MGGLERDDYSMRDGWEREMVGERWLGRDGWGEMVGERWLDRDGWGEMVGQRWSKRGTDWTQGRMNR